MVVNYSKWDALELSDDSDIEVHPNVDKRSFIRAKQRQIHEERDRRRHEIKTLKYERTVNDGMLERIDALLASLRSHAAQAVGGNAGDFMMQALMDCTPELSKDTPPEPPEGVHYKEKQPKYSEMLAQLVDQVKQEVGAEPKDWYQSYLAGVEEHRAKVGMLQKGLLARLSELEKEESRKITSDDIRTGFDASSVTKEKATAQEAPKPKAKAETVEVLNPGSLKGPLKRFDSDGQTSGADADIDEPKQTVIPDEDDIEASELAKEFAKIKIGQYQDCLRFISQHSDILGEKETDGLLMEAFTAQMDGKDAYAKQCVHQGLLVQYCRSLGRDGVGLFFKRITTPGHNAQKMFLDDVNTTYDRIRKRTAELAKERAANVRAAEEQGGVEQIQLQAVEPGTEIHINLPQPDSKDDFEQQARIVFERFPPGFQRALESGSLDRVNEVLGKMSVSEAEEVVEQLGDSGMLSMEQGVIDGTTEEGQRKIEELEGKAREGKTHTQAEDEYDADRVLDELEGGSASDQIEVAGPD